MRYRNDLDRIKIVGDIPKVFYYIVSPYPFIFTVESMFVIAFKAWFKFGDKPSWASYPYLAYLDERDIPHPRVLPNPRNRDSEKELYEMVGVLFSRMNEKADILEQFFDGIFKASKALGAEISDITFPNKGEFKVHLELAYDDRY